MSLVVICVRVTVAIPSQPWVPSQPYTHTQVPLVRVSLTVSQSYSGNPRSTMDRQPYIPWLTRDCQSISDGQGYSDKGYLSMYG